MLFLDEERAYDGAFGMLTNDEQEEGDCEAVQIWCLVSQHACSFPLVMTYPLRQPCCSGETLGCLSGFACGLFPLEADQTGDVCRNGKQSPEEDKINNR